MQYIFGINNVKLYRVSTDRNIDITDFVGELTMRTNIDEISDEVSFDMARDDENFPSNIINLGDILFLTDGKSEIWRGIVQDLKRNGRNKLSYKAYDFGWYFNKNEESYQFNNSVSENIKRICNDFKIPIGNIVRIPTSYKKVTRGKLNEIISKMLELAQKDLGKKYIAEMRGGKFYVEERNNNVVTYTTNQLPYKNINIVDNIGDPSYSESLSEFYNAVKVVSQEENEFKTLAYQESKGSIAKYGKIQKLEFLSKEDAPKAKNIAYNQLKELNKIPKEISVQLLGNIQCRSGRVLDINEPITGIVGKFLIRECTHKFKEVHTMDITLGVI